MKKCLSICLLGKNLCLALLLLGSQCKSQQYTRAVPDTTAELDTQNDASKESNDVLNPKDKQSTLGPIQITLDPTQILLKKDQLQLPIILINPNEQAIALNALHYELQIHKKKKVVLVRTHQELDLNLTNVSLQPKQSYPVSIALDAITTQRILKQPKKFSCYFFITAKDQKQTLGSIQQHLKLLVGPLKQPNSLGVHFQEVMKLRFDERSQLWWLKISVMIDNPNPYPVNLKHAGYDLCLTGLKFLDTIFPDTMQKAWFGSDIRKDQDIWLGQGEAYHLSMVAHTFPGKHTIEEIQKCLHKNPLTAKLTITTKDDQCILATATRNLSRVE